MSVFASVDKEQRTIKKITWTLALLTLLGHTGFLNYSKNSFVIKLKWFNIGFL